MGAEVFDHRRYQQVRSGFVGRDGELAVIASAVADGQAPVALVVTGEPGIGKSALLHEASERLAAGRWFVLRATADLLERTIPYATVARMVAPLAGAGLASGVRESATELALTLERVGGRRGAEVESSFGAICGQVTELVRGLLDGQPVAVVIDDIDALDDDTLALLAIVVRRLPAARLALLATSRTEPASGHPAYAELVRRLEAEARFAWVALAPLGEDDIAALVAPVLGGAPDRMLLGEINSRADGNPFFAVEIAVSLRDSGWVELDGDGARLAEAAGEVRLTGVEALLRRFTPLPAEPRQVLEVVALLERARPGDVALVAQAAGVSQRAAADAFDELVGANLLICTGGAYRFGHDLVRDAVYQRIGPARRRVLHGTIAEQMAAGREAGHPVELLTLAHHVSMSADPGDTAAVGILTEAGDLARVAAPGAAASFYGQALALATAEDDRRGLLLARRCRALTLAGSPAEATEVGVHALVLLPAGSERRSTVPAVINCLVEQGQLEEALAVADAELARERPSPVLLADQARVLWALERFEEALAQARRATELPAGSAAERLLTLGPLAVQSAYTYQPVPVTDLAEEMLRLGEGLGETLQLYATAIASYALATALFPRRAAGPLTRAEALLHDSGGTAFRSNVAVARVFVDWLAGRWDEALDGIRATRRELGRAHYELQMAALDAIEIEILTRRGAKVPARLLESVAPTPNFADLKAWAVAGARQAAGDWDGARVALDHPMRRTDLGVAYQELAFARRVEVELAAGDRAAAAAALERLEGLGAAKPHPLTRVLTGRCRALVGGDPAPARDSVAAADDAGIPLEGALSAVVWAELDAAAGAGGGPWAEPLVAAYRTFHELGADPLRRRARSQLAASGLKIPRQRRASGGLLRDTEMRIARLVQQGLRNKEIAQVLHYSPRTVEVYLSCIFAKLGVSSRLELARALDRLALPPGE